MVGCTVATVQLYHSPAARLRRPLDGLFGMINGKTPALHVLGLWLPLTVLATSVAVLLSTIATAAFSYEVAEFRCGILPPEFYPELGWIVLLIPQSTAAVVFSGFAFCFKRGPSRHLFVALGGVCLVWWLYNATAMWGACPVT